MKPATALLVGLLLTGVIPSRSSASGIASGIPSDIASDTASHIASDTASDIASDTESQHRETHAASFSADDFDWREVVNSLFVASTLPPEQGIKMVLEKSTVVRAYVMNEVVAECGGDRTRCAAKAEGSTLEGEVDRRIDHIVDEGMIRRHKSAIVDYSMGQQPFPFSEVAAIRSENKQDAYFILQFAEHSYTVSDMEAKYGAPYDTDVVQWYSVFKYKLEDPRYTGRAVFQVNPVDGAVLKVAISLKPKKHK